MVCQTFDITFQTISSLRLRAVHSLRVQRDRPFGDSASRGIAGISLIKGSVLQGLYKNALHPTCHLVHNLFKLNVQGLLYVNLIVVYHRGLSLGLCYMFCTLHQWLIS